MRICPKCGFGIADDSMEICPICGAAVTKPDTEAPERALSRDFPSEPDPVPASGPSGRVEYRENETVYCQACGSPMPASAQFCPVCGARRNAGISAPYAPVTGQNAEVFAQPVPAKKRKNGGTSGLVLGILAAIFAIPPYIRWIGIILGVIGIIVSAVAISRAGQEGQKNIRATVGLVLSILAVTAVVIIYCVSCAGCMFLI